MQFSQAPSKARWLVALVIATIVYLIVCTSLEGKLPNDLAPRFAECMQASCSPMLSRVVEYCALDTPSGHDGKYSQLSEWKLASVVLNIRHGDRTSIHTLGDTPHPSLRKDYIVPEALHFVPSPNLHHSLEVPDTLLDKGQLTSRGYMQHIQLGRFLRDAYSPLLPRLNNSKHVYIRSTNYARTLQSVTALTSQLLPQSLQYHINYFPNPKDEVMLIDFSTQSTSCRRAVKAETEQQHAYQRTSEHVYTQIEAALGLTREKFASPVAVTELADTALPSVCHASTPLQRPFPCVVMNNKKQCMTPEFVAMIMNESDIAYCRRFTDPAGGALSTRLFVYPFMQQIKEYLIASTKPYGSKLVIFSGHDTVIAPVLAALGVYEHVCRWPRYASRIGLEVWTKDTLDTSVLSSYMVRVLFNGDDMTQFIPTCKGYLLHSNSAYLCPLLKVVEQIDGLVGSYASWNDACNDVS